MALTMTIKSAYASDTTVRIQPQARLGDLFDRIKAALGCPPRLPVSAMTVSYGGVRIPTSHLDKSLAEHGFVGDRTLSLWIKPPSDYVCPIIVSIAEYENQKTLPPHHSILVRGDVTGEAKDQTALQGRVVPHMLPSPNHER
jgi:hypothetical protein